MEIAGIAYGNIQRTNGNLSPSNRNEYHRSRRCDRMKAPNELEDGFEIEAHGHTHRFYHVHVLDRNTE